jgi:hypothetical protein
MPLSNRHTRTERWLTFNDTHFLPQTSQSDSSAIDPGDAARWSVKAPKALSRRSERYAAIVPRGSDERYEEMVVVVEEERVARRTTFFFFFSPFIALQHTRDSIPTPQRRLLVC